MSYAVHIRNASRNSDDIEFWKSRGYEYVQLPDNEALMVAGDAPEEIKNAAFDASNGDYDAYKLAIGMEPQPEEELSEEEFQHSFETVCVKPESDHGIERQPEGEAE